MLVQLVKGFVSGLLKEVRVLVKDRHRFSDSLDIILGKRNSVAVMVRAVVLATEFPSFADLAGGGVLPVSVEAKLRH